MPYLLDDTEGVPACPHCRMQALEKEHIDLPEWVCPACAAHFVGLDKSAVIEVDDGDRTTVHRGPGLYCEETNIVHRDVPVVPNNYNGS